MTGGGPVGPDRFFPIDIGLIASGLRGPDLRVWTTGPLSWTNAIDYYKKGETRCITYLGNFARRADSVRRP